MNVFITGGTSGIGKSLALRYQKSGHRVAVCGRDLSKLSEDEKSKLISYTVDVKKRDEVKAAILDFSKDGLDLVIAAAGRSHGKKTKRPDFDAAIDIIDINVNGVLYTFEAALDYMIPKGKGHIVAIGSVAGLMGLPGASAYSASKAAVLTLCESYSLDLKKYNIDVTAIAPGFIDTPLTRKNDHSMPFLMDAQEGARRIENAIAKKKNLYIFPNRMKCVVLFLNKMPRFMYRFFMTLPFANYSKD